MLFLTWEKGVEILPLSWKGKVILVLRTKVQAQEAEDLTSVFIVTQQTGRVVNAVNGRWGHSEWCSERKRCYFKLPVSLTSFQSVSL